MTQTPLLLDISRLLWRAWERRMPTGIDRTCLAYVAHYRDQARAVIQRGGLTHIASPDLSQALFDLLLRGDRHFRRKLVALLASNMGSLFTRQDVANLPYLNVGHTGLNLPGHATWLRESGVQPVYFVHDLIPMTHPEYCRAGERERHEDRVRALLKSARGVIANSRNTLDALYGFARSQHLPEPLSLVAPLGVPVLPHPSDPVTPPLGRPYFVMLGTIEARKNHLMMLTAWANLARERGRAAPQLVIIGQRGWESEQAVDMLDRCEALRHHVIEIPRCDDTQLVRYLQHARALLFPSFAEGYGLPLVEALAVGTPVIASALPVFRELAGDIPDYLSPLDGLGWAAAAMEYARDDSAARAAQLQRLKRYIAPSWTDHFAQTDEWLNVLANF